MKEYTNLLEGVQFHRVFFDESTGDFDIQVKICDHDLHQVKKQIKGGTWQLRNQCLKCGNLDGNAISQDGVDMSKVLIAIETPNTWEDFKKERESIFARVTIASEKIKSNPTNFYYQTKKWKKKRKLVLDRDGHKCRACEDAPATQVHHLTYKHFENEPLFDLISICDRCHTSISKMDKGLDYTPIKHD